MVAPITSNYRGLDLLELPPNGQGLTALVMLNILERFDLAALDPVGAERFHIMLEAARLAYAVRDTHVADPACMRASVPDLLDKTFGPEVVFQKVPPAGRFDVAPSEGSCHFGHVKIDGRSGAMTVTHRDAMGGVLHSLDLAPT